MEPLFSNPSASLIPDWQQDFKTAIQSGELHAARAVIFQRLKAKTENPPGILERIALNDAIFLLKSLHNERSPIETPTSQPDGRA